MHKIGKILALFLLVFSQPVLADVTSYKFGSCASVSNGGGGAAWTNPTNAQADDTSEAAWSVPTTHTNPSEDLKCTTFNFTSSDVPSGATINGIEVEYRRRENSILDNCAASRVRTVKGGTVSGSNVSTMNTTEWVQSANETGAENITEGGASNLWTETWADTDITSSGFGIAIAATANGTTPDCYIDYIKARIYYTPATTTIPESTSIIVGY